MTGRAAVVLVETPGEVPLTFVDVVAFVILTGDGQSHDASLLPPALFADVLRSTAANVEADKPQGVVSFREEDDS